MTEGTTGQTLEQRLAAVEADANKYKEQAQTWMGKFTDIEKRLNGKSIDSLIAAAEERDILARQAAEKDPKKLDEEVNRVRQEFGPKLEEKDRTIQKLSGRIKEMTVVDEAVKRVGDSLYKNAHEDFRAFIRANCSLNENDEIVVVDGNGKPRYSPADPSKLMTLDELISGLKTSRDHWWASKVPAGGHDPAKGSGGAVGTIKNYADMEAMSKTHDIKTVADAFAKLPEETKKAIRLEMRAKGIQV